MRMTKIMVLVAAILALTACDTGNPAARLTIDQAIEALPTPAEMGRPVVSAPSGNISPVVHPFTPGSETPPLTSDFYLVGMANGGMDFQCAGFYGEIIHLLKSLSAEDFATGSHIFTDLVELGGATVEADWSENDGAFTILVMVSEIANSVRSRIDITQADGKVNATMVIKISNYDAYYATTYDEASGNCEVFLTSSDTEGVPTPDAYSMYWKTLRTSDHALTGVVSREAGVDELITTAYIGHSGSAGRKSGYSIYFDQESTPFHEVYEETPSRDIYRMAGMTAYPDHLAFDDAYLPTPPTGHPFFYDYDDNGIFDDSVDMDVPGGIGVGLYPLTQTEAGYYTLLSGSRTFRPYLEIPHGDPLPAGFTFDPSLLTLKASLDAGLATYAEPFAATLVNHADAQTRLVALIMQEEASFE